MINLFELQSLVAVKVDTKRTVGITVGGELEKSLCMQGIENASEEISDHL